MSRRQRNEGGASGGTGSATAAKGISLTQRTAWSGTRVTLRGGLDQERHLGAEAGAEVVEAAGVDLDGRVVDPDVLARAVRGAGIGVTASTVPSSGRSGKASTRIRAFWPAWIDATFDSLTWARTCMWLGSGRLMIACPWRTVTPSWIGFWVCPQRFGRVGVDDDPVAGARRVQLATISSSRRSRSLSSWKTDVLGELVGA